MSRKNGTKPTARPDPKPPARIEPSISPELQERLGEAYAVHQRALDEVAFSQAAFGAVVLEACRAAGVSPRAFTAQTDGASWKLVNFAEQEG